MANFFDEMQNTINHSDDNKIFTANGAVAYASTGDSLVDFSYSASSLRNKTPEEIMTMFHRCYTDNPLMATKLMFQMGDVREGKGERRTFSTCLQYIALVHPEICKALLPLVPEYTRWDHVSRLMICGDPAVQKFARAFMAEQLRHDYELLPIIERDNARREELNRRLDNATTDKQRQQIQREISKIPHHSLSLCAKWAPKLGAKKDGRHKEALKLVQTLGIPKAEYRKMRSAIISHLNVAEQALSAGRIEDINLEHMTSAQQARYSGVMQTKNADAYNEYLDKVESGEAKMNAQVLTPADIVHRYSSNTGWRYNVKPFDRTLENLWDNLKQVQVPDGKSCIVVRDDSGSMENCISDHTDMTAAEVATALTLYCAERLQGAFKDKFISFSEHPKLLDVSPFNSLHDRLRYACEHSEVANTDVKAVFDLMLSTALHNNTPPEEMPGTVLLISDMEFDEGTRLYGSDNGSYAGEMPPALFDEIREQWAAVGYKMPVLAFWNLNAERAVVPDINDRGVVLLSGFTTDNLDMVMNGDLADFTPAKQMQMVLSKPRYDAVEAAFREGLAAERKSGTREPLIAEFVPDEGYSKVSGEPSEDEHDDEYDDFDYDD